MSSGLRRDREPVSLGQRAQRAEARTRARRRDARAVEAGVPVFEYTPAEIKRAVVGHGRAEKAQVQQMVKLLLGLPAVPSPHGRRGRAGGRHLPRALAAACARRRPRQPGRAAAQPRDELADLSSRLRARGATARQARTIVIAHLRGAILEKHPNRIVLDVQGVGYDVFVPLSTFYGLGDPGTAVALRIHTHVREDALTLYGFATLLEQDLFERADWRQRYRTQARARRVVGDRADGPHARHRARRRRPLDRNPRRRQKTSERIVLELKDRLPRVQAAAVAAGGGASDASALRDDVLSALVNLGYHRPLAEKPSTPRSRRPGRRPVPPSNTR